VVEHRVRGMQHMATGNPRSRTNTPVCRTHQKHGALRPRPVRTGQRAGRNHAPLLHANSRSSSRLKHRTAKDHPKNNKPHGNIRSRGHKHPNKRKCMGFDQTESNKRAKENSRKGHTLESTTNSNRRREMRCHDTTRPDREKKVCAKE